MWARPYRASPRLIGVVPAVTADDHPDQGLNPFVLLTRRGADDRVPHNTALRSPHVIAALLVAFWRLPRRWIAGPPNGEGSAVGRGQPRRESEPEPAQIAFPARGWNM